MMGEGSLSQFSLRVEGCAAMGGRHLSDRLWHSPLRRRGGWTGWNSGDCNVHISEGVLSGPVLISGIALSAVGVAAGLRKLDYDRIPRAGILAASFFVASLIHVPIGPSSVHLILNGIVGLILGWGAFPVILVALALQAVFFQFGGITTLGVNTMIMALPAVFCYYLFLGLAGRHPRMVLPVAFSCGAVSVLLGAVMVGLALTFTEEGFLKVSYMVVIAHIPVMIIEGVVTCFCVAFLRKVKPEMLPSRGG
jgi:cobalt/nickel transport system permease protein